MKTGGPVSVIEYQVNNLKHVVLATPAAQFLRTP